MTVEKSNKIEVQIKYKDIEKTVSTEKLEDAWLLLDKFFHQTIPSFEIANRLCLDVDLTKLTKDLEGVIAFSSEGSSLLLPKTKLTDNETLILWLIASYTGRKLNKLETDSLSKEELQTKLGKSGKITSTRLGELVKNDMVTRVNEDRFRITTYGVVQTQKDILPKIRTKTNI
ncbi:MAG TPA: hypothetical protein VK209_06270 [Candidatus Sulfotelmatobacter sp.]|nr:hypothetical protein [Candidatus Sulfotelmatobacter sp.]